MSSYNQRRDAAVAKTVAGIDDVINAAENKSCLGCGGDILDGSSSDLWCGEYCQEITMQRQTDSPWQVTMLRDYRHGTLDTPMRWTPDASDAAGPAPDRPAGATYAVLDELQEWQAALLSEWFDANPQLLEQLEQNLVAGSTRLAPTPAEVRARALEARRNRNTGPQQRRRPPRDIHPGGAR